MRKSVLIVLFMFVAPSARADLFECGHSAARRVTAPLAGVSHVTVIARAGSLRVTGRPGAREVVASGTACADGKNLLDDLQLTAKQSGSELTIEAVVPARTSIFGWNSARLDFEVTLPDSLALDVTDGSGEAIIENVGPVKVNDGSGTLTIRGVRGNADVHDGSGSLTVSGVSGDLRIVDGSGEIEVERVGGSVTIDDGSGSISVRNVQRNVTVEDDGSGGIEVGDIRGDFTVKNDGSGGIDYERVGGRVTIPHKR